MCYLNQHLAVIITLPTMMSAALKKESMPVLLLSLLVDTYGINFKLLGDFLLKLPHLQNFQKT